MTAAKPETRQQARSIIDNLRGRTAPNPPVERQTMTIPELARTLGISRTTCYELARLHQLPVTVVRVGRRLLVSRVQVARFLEGQSE
jgi:excisionase family DNA binding protein